MDYRIKENLAIAYRIIASLGLEDHTYTHLSARPDGADYYYIYPFGTLYEEVESNNLLKVNLAGIILEGKEYQYNKTGYTIHGSIYKARKDINAIFHLHTHSTVAVSAMKCGLMPISQWALHFYDRISYHKYASLALDLTTHGGKLTEDLGDNYVMFLRNHGFITSGQTIEEAMFYTYHLEQACKTQIMALSSGQELIIPSEEICKQSVNDLLSFEKELGKRDFAAWIRKLAK